MRSLGGFPLRTGFLLFLIPLLLIALQLLVVGSRLPGAARSWMGMEERDAMFAFSVMSIDPERSSSQQGARSRRPGTEEEEVVDYGEIREGARVYEDENEMHERQVGPRAIEMQEWAADKPSFTAELTRIIMFITKLQMNCSRILSPGPTQAEKPPVASTHWQLCGEDWLLPAADGPCVAYSFSMDGGDADFLRTVSKLGCQVHNFDPSSSNASGGHLSNSLTSNSGIIQHKMWLEWRTQKRRRHKTKGNLGSVSQTLADIMAALGHRTVHFLYADFLSAEWRIFQNWIEAGTIQHIHHLVATVHLQWAGFEVGGTDEEVLRFWYSVLRGLQASGLMLVHSSAGQGHTVLKQTVENAHSSYTLSWANTRH